ncbi:uncharacterized protein LOC26535118 isoform X2 [Drosophila yakuba]|uniref:uncharacterized protein LOC26535118 isoform X2 n=1 Tax=Drosophila yakuba TaxID=7245 RepID=UPI0019307C9C|nr:uncharacterized protein LOC26535118 isoform X2 [Drosophila yakuba]
MQLGIICLIIMLQAGKNDCGIKSHAELIRLAIKADNKIKDLIHNVSGFVNGNSEFKEKYENLRIPLMENYTSLPTKLAHIREFKAYNKERLNLEEGIKSAISKLHTTMSEDCQKLSAKLRKQLLLMLVATNKKKIDALDNFEKGSCQRQSSTSNITPSSVRSITYNPSALLTFPSKNICKSSLKVSDLCLINETKMTYTSSMPSNLTILPKAVKHL